MSDETTDTDPADVAPSQAEMMRMFMAQQEERVRYRSPEERLFTAIGKIAVETHGVSQVFNLGGVLRDVPKLRSAFDDRFTAWRRVLADAFHDRPKAMADLRALDKRIDRARVIRDAMMHGGPRIRGMGDDGEIWVECRIEAAKSRYWELSVQHVKRTTQGPYRRRRIQMAKIMPKHGWESEVSFSLTEIERIARDLRNIHFDVMDLTAQGVRLTRSGYANEFRANPEGH